MQLQLVYFVLGQLIFFSIQAMEESGLTIIDLNDSPTASVYENLNQLGVEVSGNQTRLGIALGSIQDINALDGNGQTLLHKAFIEGNIELIRWLLKNGAMVDVCSSSGETMLHYAMISKNKVAYLIVLHEMREHYIRLGKTPEEIEVLLKDYINARAHGFTAMHAIGVNDHIDAVMTLISLGADFDIAVDGITPLLLAIYYRALNVVKELIGRGARLDGKAFGGSTALHLAIKELPSGSMTPIHQKCDELELINLLLEFGLSLDEPDDEGESPVVCAIKLQKFKIAERLIESGASKQQVFGGLTLMHFAAEYGTPEFIEFLCRRGVSIDQVDLSGKSPLHYAVRNQHTATALKLIELGAKFDVCDENKRTPLAQAIVDFDKKMVFQLIACGASLSEVDLEASPFQSIVDCLKNLFEIRSADAPLETENTVDFLIRIGVDLNQFDENRNTLLHAAIRARNLVLARKLLINGAQFYKNTADESPFDIARRMEYSEGLALLENVDIPDENGDFPLNRAVRTGDLKRVCEIIGLTRLPLRFSAGRAHDARGKLWNAFKIASPRLIFDAIRSKKPEVLRLLMQHGLDKGYLFNDAEGMTALEEIFEESKFLFLNVVNDALYQMHKSDRNDFLNRKDSNGETPLIKFIKKKNVGLVRWLLSFNINVMVTDFYGETPLHCALESMPEIIEELIQAGAWLNAKNSQWLMPFMKAAMRGKVEALGILLRHGKGIINSCDRNGDTALHHAARWGHVDAVKLLLDAGAHPGIRNNQNQSVLSAACVAKVEQTKLNVIIQMLLEKMREYPSGPDGDITPPMGGAVAPTDVLASSLILNLGTVIIGQGSFS